MITFLAQVRRTYLPTPLNRPHLAVAQYMTLQRHGHRHGSATVAQSSQCTTSYPGRRENFPRGRRSVFARRRGSADIHARCKEVQCVRVTTGLLQAAI